VQPGDGDVSSRRTFNRRCLRVMGISVMRRSMHTGSLERIVVVGASGSGKTTFAHDLAKILGAPHVELDALYWGPNWIANSEEDILGKLRKQLEADRWIVDGNLSKASAEAHQSATSIVWLNYSFPVVFQRAVRRTFRRIVTRERLYSDNFESISQVFERDWIPWWVIRTFRRRRREYRALFSSPEFSSRDVIELADPQAAEEFLARLRAG
jgi:adenylate kinase family enzyme